MLKFMKASGAGAVFDPPTVHVVIAAFDDAWGSLQTSGAPFANEDYIATAREILAKYIIDAAEKGERDQHRLSEGALLHLVQSKLRKIPRGGQLNSD